MSISDVQFLPMLYSVGNGAKLADAATDVDIVAMGINPSRAELHLGHYLTMFQAMMVTAQQKARRMIAFVDDREFDLKPGQYFDEYARYPKPAVTRAVHDLMQRFIDSMSQQLRESSLQHRISIVPMSEFLRQQVAGEFFGGELYDVLHRNRSCIEHVFEFTENEPGKRHIIRPVCPSCEFGSTVDDTIDLQRDRIRGCCRRRSCEYGGYSTRPGEGEDHWGMHYAVDPLRDILLARHHSGKVLHIFGGDYGMYWGRRGTPKAQRLTELIAEIAPDVHVDHFTGPLLQRDGRKLAKSSGDATSDLPTMRELDALLRDNSAVLEV